MRSNIKNALIVPECSMVVEAAHASVQIVGHPHWLRSFHEGIRDGYSIYRLINTVRNSAHEPIQGKHFWDAFRARGW